MSDKDKRILDTLQKLMLGMTETEKDYLLCFGEGMLAATQQLRTAASA